MSKFSEQVKITIEGFTQPIVYYDLVLSQKMMDHHYFSFVWQYTGKPIIKPADQAAALRKYKGYEVIFTFKVNGIQLMSKGIISKLKSIDVNGSPVGLYVTGVSHSILLDDMKKARIFSGRNLQDIALNIFAEETAGEFYQRPAIEPTYTKIFDYKPQYNETSFNFLKRLSARYAQWFYFDGMRIQFGQLKTSKVKLINGSSLHNFGIETNLMSHKTSFAGYDPQNAANIRSSQGKTNMGSADSFSRVVADRQASVSHPNLNVAAYTNQAKNAAEMEEIVKLQTAARHANGVLYTGISYFPIGVGQVFSIQNQTVEHELLAIEVKHLSQVNGNYSCEFKAIPADVGVPPYTDVDVFAQAQSQPALVKDNNDPDGLGRIKVTFYWGSGGTTSDWMRVTQQYSGEGRGIYWRPEIGDEVMIDFEGGNADCPYVSGSYYNGKAKPEFFDQNNNTKGWKLRFGQLFKFIEKVGIWLSDPSGNQVHLSEEEKSMTLTTPGTLTLNCKDLIINVGENMTTNVTINKTDITGVNHSENIGGLKTLGVGGDFNSIVEGQYLEHIKGDFESTTEKDRHDNGKQSLNHNTEGDLNKNAQKEIQNNSGEQTRQN